MSMGKFGRARVAASAWVVGMIAAAGAARGTLIFDQNFNSSGTVSDYVSATPDSHQFNAISSSGAGTVVSISGGALSYARTANAGSFSRTTDFSPTPDTLVYQLDLSVSGNSTATTSAAIFQVGSAYGTANST